MEWPRLILNDDASNFLMLREGLSDTDLRTYLERYAATQVGMVCYCAAFGGGITYYDSEVGERVGNGYWVSHRLQAHRIAANQRRLAREGGYIPLVFETLRDLGLPVLASLRMNDCHMSTHPTSHVAGRFWMDHQDCRLDPSYGYYAGGLDYARKPVRQFMKALVREVLERFPYIDGIELDFMRSPYLFNPGEGESKTGVLTDFIRDIRGILCRAAADDRNNHGYVLRANVPADPAFAYSQGMDITSWAEDELVDSIAVGAYATDMATPLGYWRELAGPDLHLAAYINCGAQMGSYLTTEQYRAAAANAYGYGADSVYLFNFPCFDELAGLVPTDPETPALPLPAFEAGTRHPRIPDIWEVLQELGDPDAVSRRPRHYLFYMAEQAYGHYPPGPVELTRQERSRVKLPFQCWHPPRGSRTAHIRLKAVSITPAETFSFSLNGIELAPRNIVRQHSFRGRDVRIHPVALDPYSQFDMTVAGERLRVGENVLEVTVNTVEPGLVHPIDLAELEVIVDGEE